MKETMLWYASQLKPAFAPPAWLFAPIWTVLYVIIAITYIRVFHLAYKRAIPKKVILPFAFNLIFNFAFSPLQFQLHSYYLSSVDIVLILGTIIWGMAAVWPYSRKLALWQVPYLVWVSFATVLQLTVVWLNSGLSMEYLRHLIPLLR